jgi:2,4-diaminopentanoate dehydrogenase
MPRILQVGFGPLGRFIVTDLLTRGIGELAGVVDPDPSLAGRPIQEFLPSGIAPHHPAHQVRIAPTIGAAIPDAGPIDCAVLSTSSDLRKCEGSLRDLLGRGLSVVSTCEELLFPWLRHAGFAAELHKLAVANHARVLGTGVNPGFLMDTLPVAATAVCRDVRAVHVWRIQDATPRRVPFQQKIGAGLGDAEFAAKVKAGTLRHVGLGESLHFIARYLGFAISRWEETIEPVRATRDLTSAIGQIEKGKAAGVRQTARGYTGSGKQERAVITMEFQAAIGQENPHDRVVIEGEPPIDLMIKGGVHGDIATSAITLNAIAPLLASPPGLHTMATIPLVHFSPRG